MTEDRKQKALSEVRRTQSRFEQSQNRLNKDSKARRESFERAHEAGATLREIGKAAGLHWSTVATAIRKE